MDTEAFSGITWIGDAEVQELLTPVECREAVTRALLAHEAGDYDQPLKPYVRPGGRRNEHYRGRLISMPAYVGHGVNRLGVKLITGFPVNVERGIQRAHGLCVLFDTETGVPCAVMDCRTLSARRTAAVAAICVDHLGSLDERRVGILGAGPIARATVLALVTCHGIKHIRVFDPWQDRTEQLIDGVKGMIDIVMESSVSAEECVRGSNVIITATSNSAQGYLKREWLQNDWLIVALSLDDSEPEVLLQADKLVCDDFDQGNREEKLLHRLTSAGLLGRADMYAELSEILAGKKQGRKGGESIYVNCMGMAIEDVAVAGFVYEAAKKSGLNTQKEA